MEGEVQAQRNHDRHQSRCERQSSKDRFSFRLLCCIVVTFASWWCQLPVSRIRKIFGTYDYSEFVLYMSDVSNVHRQHSYKWYCLVVAKITYLVPPTGSLVCPRLNRRIVSYRIVLIVDILLGVCLAVLILTYPTLRAPIAYIAAAAGSSRASAWTHGTRLCCPKR